MYNFDKQYQQIRELSKDLLKLTNSGNFNQPEIGQFQGVFFLGIDEDTSLSFCKYNFSHYFTEYTF